jgi:hypothetical protein
MQAANRLPRQLFTLPPSYYFCPAAARLILPLCCALLARKSSRRQCLFASCSPYQARAAIGSYFPYAPVYIKKVQIHHLDLHLSAARLTEFYHIRGKKSNHFLNRRDFFAESRGSLRRVWICKKNVNNGKKLLKTVGMMLYNT